MLSAADPRTGGLVFTPTAPTLPLPMTLPKPPENKPRVESPLLKLIRSRPPPATKNGKHLILDLDETLVHTFMPEDNLHDFITELTAEQRTRLYSIKFASGDVLQGYIRPYAEDFLRVAFQEFESVGVWSAGTQEYVRLIVGIVFKEQKPVFVLSRDQCDELRVKDETRPCRYKPLDVIYHRFPDHNAQNTVIVDDRHDVCSLNCMNNIRVPEFAMAAVNYDILVKDQTLLTLANWFQSESFRRTPHVHQLKSQSPFKI